MIQKRKVKKSGKSMQVGFVHHRELARRDASRTGRGLPINVLPINLDMSPVATWPVGREAVIVCFTPALPTIR